MRSDRIWILGAPDPEMAMTERLLAEVGERVVHALDETDQRVHPGSAYRVGQAPILLQLNILEKTLDKIQGGR